jgi:hypothetical protein
MDISRKLINDLGCKSTLTGTFFNERWMQDNAEMVAEARRQHAEANKPRLQMVCESEEKINYDRLESKVQIGGERETAKPKEKN